MKTILRHVLLASGAQITSADILNPNLFKYWNHIQNEIITYKFPPIFDAVKHFAVECENIYHKLSAENTLQYDWDVLNKINVAKLQISSKTPYTLNHQKLLQIFCDNFNRMVQANDAKKPNGGAMDKQCLVLNNLLDRVRTTLQSSEVFDKNDSAIHSENSMSDNENSVVLQYMIALTSATPVISNARVNAPRPQRISLLNEFHLVPNLEYVKKSI